MTPTMVFDTYWQFAAERLAMLYRRYRGHSFELTEDAILQNYRFTNTYRVTDRISQYLIAEVQAREDRSQIPREVFFRTMLFKIFNRIDTWEALEDRFGPLQWEGLDLPMLDRALSELRQKGRAIYSAAYIMPAPQLGYERKHSNHLALIKLMIGDRVPERIRQAPSLKDIYELILSYPGLGSFLAFQYAIDLNYSNISDFDESDFVVAGPGALDGISKCFADTRARKAEDIIYWMTDCQDAEFKRLGIDFPGLFGRKLQPIDCQNLFCEISKYARVAHPTIEGVAKRTRIKQVYRQNPQPLAALKLPEKWGVSISPAKKQKSEHATERSPQLSLL